VIGIAKRFAHESRIFTLGIGSSASTHLVRGIASASGGTCAFVKSDDNIPKQVLCQLKNAMQPAFFGVDIKWEGIEAPPPPPESPERKLRKTQEAQVQVASTHKMTLRSCPTQPDSSSLNALEPPPEDEIAKIAKYYQAPSKIPPVFHGSQLVVVGIFPAGEKQPTGVQIDALSSDGPVSIKMKVTSYYNVWHGWKLIT